MDDYRKVLCDIYEALTVHSDGIVLTPEELFKKIFLKLYYIANYVSIWTEDKTEDYEKYEEHAMSWLQNKGYDISKEDLQKARTDAENFAVDMWRAGKVAKSPFTGSVNDYKNKKEDGRAGVYT